MEELSFKFGTNNSPVVIGLREYKGRKLVDIRKFYSVSKESDEILPTRKGISLNLFQFTELMNTFRSNKEVVEDFFNSSNLISETEIDTLVQSTTGRNFKIDFLNNSTQLTIDPNLDNKLNHCENEMFKKMILNIHIALNEVLDDEGDVSLVLDVFDKKLNKAL